MKTELIFITGGIKSGKSRFAVNAVKSNNKASCIVTGLPLDKEMKRRISLHKQNRPSSWQVIEEPVRLIDALTKVRFKTVIIDCINFWVANVINKYSENMILEQAEGVCTRIKKSGWNKCYIVSNEAGLGLVSEYKSGRKFQEVLGKVNQVIAAQFADTVYFMVSGIPVKIK